MPAENVGIELTPEVERRYPFRPDAGYRCLVPEAEGVSAWSR